MSRLPSKLQRAFQSFAENWNRRRHDPVEIRGLRSTDIGRLRNMDAGPWQQNRRSFAWYKQNIVIRVAEYRGVPVGYCVCRLDEDRATIVALEVDFDYQRQRVGTRLIDDIRAIVDEVSVLIDERNLDALQFLRGLGFLSAGYVRLTETALVPMRYKADSRPPIAEAACEVRG